MMMMMMVVVVVFTAMVMLCLPIRTCSGCAYQADANGIGSPRTSGADLGRAGGRGFHEFGLGLLV